MKLALAGYYKITATDKDTKEERVLADWFPNIITNNGLNLINTGNHQMNQYCYVGSGSTVPTATDSSMQTFVAAIYSAAPPTYNAQPTAPYYGFALRTWTFAPGEATGNLSEVGCGMDTLGLDLFSRALITDAGGTPITITVLANDYLTVVYELRCYPPLTDVVATMPICGVSTEVTVRSANVTSASDWGFYSGSSQNTAATAEQNSTFAFWGTLGTITGTPTNIICRSPAIAATDTYTPGSYHRDHTAYYGLADANSVAGISAIVIPTFLGTFQIGFSPPIVKDNTRTLGINYRVSWARKTLP